jgi:phosphoglycerate dehydrogenase-like enzyme
MKQTKVALCRSGDFDPDHALVESLRMQFPTVSLVDLRKEKFADRLEELKGTEAFIGWPDDEQLHSLPLLRWVQLPSAGANGYTSGRSALREDVQITNSSGVFGVPGAEHALALLLAIARQLPIHFEQQQRKQWRRNPYSLEIDGSTAAIIGLGDIGMEIARRVKAFGASVLAVKRVASACFSRRT